MMVDKSSIEPGHANRNESGEEISISMKFPPWRAGQRSGSGANLGIICGVQTMNGQPSRIKVFSLSADGWRGNHGGKS